MNPLKTSHPLKYTPHSQALAESVEVMVPRDLEVVFVELEVAKVFRDICLVSVESEVVTAPANWLLHLLIPLKLLSRMALSSTFPRQCAAEFLLAVRRLKKKLQKCI
ncbi:hypothetical protein Bhyg_06376, partial [Pseudolycoriella hygida]